MFHTPTTETTQQNDSSRGVLKPRPVHEISPFVLAGVQHGWLGGGANPVSPLISPQQRLARLHCTYGNQAVLRMLSHSAPVIQTKLAVNKPGDEFEQEADCVADQVMRMSAPAPSIQRKCSGFEEEEKVQRKCAESEEEEKKTGLQRKETGADPQFAPPSVHAVLNSPGQPLDCETRAFMEPRFEHDFSQVRVHSDATAAESARTVDALAYTVGQHIVFNAGNYSPHSSKGARLLAHELTHTLQQSVSGADATSARIDAGRTPIGRFSSTQAIQRDPAPDAKKPATPAATFQGCDDSQTKVLKGVAEKAKAWNSNASEIFSDDARAKSLVANERTPPDIAELRQQYNKGQRLFNQGIVIRCGSTDDAICKKSPWFDNDTNTFSKCGAGLAGAPEDYLAWELLSCVLTGRSAGNFSLAATYAQRLAGAVLPAINPSSQIPDLEDEKVKSAEASISAGRFQEAIDTLVKDAAAKGRVNRDLLKDRTMHYDPSLTQEGLTDDPVKDESGGISPINVHIGPPAFKSGVSWLYSTLLHEFVHVEQFQPLSAHMPVVVKGESSEPGFVNEKEVEAYAFEIMHAEGTGLNASPARIAEIWGRLCNAYDHIPRFQKSAIEDLARKAFEKAESIVGKNRLRECLKGN